MAAHQGIMSTSKSCAKENLGTSKLHLVFFLIVAALLLGTVGACIAFTIEFVKLKSYIVSLEMKSSLQQVTECSLQSQTYKKFNPIFYQIYRYSKKCLNN